MGRLRKTANDASFPRRKRNLDMNGEFPEKWTVLFLIAAVGLCIFGAASGDMTDVFIKAVNICMECIGLG